MTVLKDITWEADPNM